MPQGTQSRDHKGRETCGCGGRGEREGEINEGKYGTQRDDP